MKFAISLSLVMFASACAGTPDEATAPIIVQTLPDPSTYAAGAPAPTPTTSDVPTTQPVAPAQPVAPTVDVASAGAGGAGGSASTAVTQPVAAGAGGVSGSASTVTASAGAGGASAGAGGSAAGAGGSAQSAMAGAGGAGGSSAPRDRATCQTPRYTVSCATLAYASGQKLSWSLPPGSGGQYWDCLQPATRTCSTGTACSVLDVDGTTSEGVCL